MSSERILAGGLFALGLAVIGGYGLSNYVGPVFAQVEDGPGPNLVIEVDGSVKGQIVIDLLPDVAPKHVAQIVALAEEGAYNDVVFHRVIEGFMAQTGDVEFGKRDGETRRAGMGGSTKADLAAEFSNIGFERGVVGMARSASPDSANSQFFITYAPSQWLDGQYTVVGRVLSGMDVVDQLKKGAEGSGAVKEPDWMSKVTVQK